MTQKELQTQYDLASAFFTMPLHLKEELLVILNSVRPEDDKLDVNSKITNSDFKDPESDAKYAADLAAFIGLLTMDNSSVSSEDIEKWFAENRHDVPYVLDWQEIGAESYLRSKHRFISHSWRLIVFGMTYFIGGKAGDFFCLDAANGAFGTYPTLSLALERTVTIRYETHAEKFVVTLIDENQDDWRENMKRR